MSKFRKNQGFNPKKKPGQKDGREDRRTDTILQDPCRYCLESKNILQSLPSSKEYIQIEYSNSNFFQCKVVFSMKKNPFQLHKIFIVLLLNFVKSTFFKKYTKKIKILAKLIVAIISIFTCRWLLNYQTFILRFTIMLERILLHVLFSF